MKRITIYATRPFHGSAYDCRLLVGPDLAISTAQYRKVMRDHGHGGCCCKLHMYDNEGNIYAILDHNRLFEI